MIRKGNFKVESGRKRKGRNRKKVTDGDNLSGAVRRDSKTAQRGGKRQTVYKCILIEMIKKKYMSGWNNLLPIGQGLGKLRGGFGERLARFPKGNSTICTDLGAIDLYRARDSEKSRS